VIDFVHLPTVEVKDYHRKGDHGANRVRRAQTPRQVPPTPFEQFDIGARSSCVYNLRTQRFAHGVRFLHLPQRTEDEIQRFIHLCSSNSCANAPSARDL